MKNKGAVQHRESHEKKSAATLTTTTTPQHM